MIKYIKGDATRPIQTGKGALICHVCNDIGAWGKGFVVALSRRFPEPEKEYRHYAAHCRQMRKMEGAAYSRYIIPMGYCQFVRCTDTITVANMVAQHDIYTGNLAPGEIPLQYAVLTETLKESFAYAHEHDLVVHMPRIGCGLAGGRWDKVAALIEEQSAAFSVPVYVYDLD